MILTLGYVRVSTLEQEQGFGPEFQADKINEYCELKDLGTPQIYYESKSGESVTRRVEIHIVLARAEAAVDAGGESNVVFYGLDRLTRDLMDQEAVVMRAFEKGVRLHSTLESENATLDPAYAGDPMRTAIRQFFGIINQLDRAIIKRRLDSGLAKKAAAGGFTGGRPPFGYRVADHDLQIDPDQAKAVNRLFRLVDAGLDNQTTAAVLGREYPELCGHWIGSQVGRCKKRRELYAQGIYRPRGADTAVQRPDLVILTEEFAPDQVPATGALDLTKIPDPVRLQGLEVLLGRSGAELRQLISRHQILVRWRKGSPLVPKDSVQRICDLVGPAGDGQNED